MMRGLLEAAHERAEPIATLWASESVIYGRFGYGVASEDVHWEIERPYAAFARPSSATGRVRLVDEVEARPRFPDAWERALAQRTGMTARSDLLWNDRFRDAPHQRGGASPYFYAAYEENGRLEGYALYRVKTNWDHFIPGNEINVVECVTATDAAHDALWRFLFDHDLSRTITAGHRPVDDPLPHMLADPRRLTRRPRDATWLRLVDVRAALEARGYASEGALVLDVRDDFCAWNSARLRLETGASAGQVTPTSEDPDLALAASALAATYLGGTRFSALARAGLIEERRAGALTRADTLFATEHAPWTPQFY
jgi:predicted acetyltransferase